MHTGTPKWSWRRYWPRLLLVIPFVMALWVPSYNRVEPKLADIPVLLLVSAHLGSHRRSDRARGLSDRDATDSASTARTALDQTGTPGDVL